VACGAFISQKILTNLEHTSASLLDDVAIGSRTVLEHINHLQTIFENLTNLSTPGLAVKLRSDKFSVFQTEMSYCGTHIANGRLRINVAKPSKFLDYRPSSVSDLSSLLSFCSYFRTHISDLPGLIKPLQDAIKASSRVHSLVWTTQMSQAYRELRRTMATLPSLFIADVGENAGRFRLYTDSSNHAIGGVLAQERYFGSVLKIVPLAYFSRLLQASERQYSIAQCELLSTTECVARWNSYLRNRPFSIFTDSSFVYYSILSLSQSTNVSANKTIARLLTSLNSLDFTISYVQSRYNCSDFFSRGTSAEIPKPQRKQRNLIYHLLVELHLNTLW